MNYVLYVPYKCCYMLLISDSQTSEYILIQGDLIMHR
jgi:hypothetical protein